MDLNTSPNKYMTKEQMDNMVNAFTKAGKRLQVEKNRLKRERRKKRGKK